MPNLKPARHSNTTFQAHTSRPGRDGRPSLSIVSVVHQDSAGTLQELAGHCLRWDRHGVELVVVHVGALHASTWRSAIAGLRMRLIPGPADAGEPQLRALGLAAATGDVVMLLDDPATVDDGWIEHVTGMGTGHAATAEDRPPAAAWQPARES